MKLCLSHLNGDLKLQKQVQNEQINEILSTIFKINNKFAKQPTKFVDLMNK